MKKIAIFVEGLTEQELVKKIIEFHCIQNGYTLELQRQFGGQLHHVSTQSILANNKATHYILIVNCCTDNQVKSQINQQYNSLQSAGYTHIIGLRDIYPNTHADIQKITSLLNYGISTQNVPVDIVLSILETETWFIGELTHFTRLTPSIDVNYVKKYLTSIGIDLDKGDLENIQHPADTLDAIYKSVGLAYNKSKITLSLTIGALCLNNFNSSTRVQSQSLDKLLTVIETAL
jgi:hypothetical protein